MHDASSTPPSLGFSIHCFPKYYNPITLNLTHYWSEPGFGLIHTYIFFCSFLSFIHFYYLFHLLRPGAVSSLCHCHPIRLALVPSNSAFICLFIHVHHFAVLVSRAFLVASSPQSLSDFFFSFSFFLFPFPIAQSILLHFLFC